MLNRSLLVAAAAALVCAAAASACDKDKKISTTKTVATAGSSCCKATLAKKVDAVMKDMPTMTYKVGDYTTCCPDAARAKASSADGKMQFVVADKAFDSETEATLALADLLESEAKSMTEVRFAVGKECYGCPMTAKKMAKDSGAKMTYRLAGMNFDSREQADRAAKMIADALRNSDGRSEISAVQATTKPSCSKAAKASADAKKPCCASKSKTASADDAKKPCCASKNKTTAASADAKKPCCASKSKTASADAKKPCSGSKTTAASADAKAPCSKSTTTTASTDAAPKCPKAAAAQAAAAAEGKSGCCEKAAARLASVQDRIRLIVETAAAAS